MSSLVISEPWEMSSNDPIKGEIVVRFASGGLLFKPDANAALSVFDKRYDFIYLHPRFDDVTWRNEILKGCLTVNGGASDRIKIDSGEWECRKLASFLLIGELYL